MRGMPTTQDEVSLTSNLSPGIRNGSGGLEYWKLWELDCQRLI